MTGADKRSPKHCRHTFASMAFKEGVQLTEISRILGHENSAITLKFYTRIIQEQADQNEHGFDLPAKFGAVR